MLMPWLSLYRGPSIPDEEPASYVGSISEREVAGEYLLRPVSAGYTFVIETPEEP
jgi:hypothetical protein